LPFCWFAYKRSLLDIVLTVVALATSTFWFPAPEQPGAGALEYLAMEREYLTGDWTVAKILLGLLAPLSFAALDLAFWKRSVVYGLVLINAMVLIKIAWSFYFGDESGGLTQLPSAIVGQAVCDAVVLYHMRRLRRRSSEPSRPAGHHG
jgi:hypothetical protein